MKFLQSLLFFFYLTFGYSQIIPNEYIVEYKPNTYKKLQSKLGSSDRALEIKSLSPDLNICLIKGVTQNKILALSQDIDYIVDFYPNTLVHPRELPNDSLYTKQWNLNIIKANRLWEITTGGSTIQDDEIVVAVLDNGFDINHEDLSDNIWSNDAEIPDDNIDNDNNGYIDDYLGLNINTGNDDHPKKDHGTGAAGIVGAKGNNSIGITGINWDVKILPISEILSTAATIEGYQYIYELRKKYNESNGEEGAYIVATSYSAGIPNVFGNVQPYRNWCDMYDLLGSVGILSCGATANDDINVDIKGDMPSTCPSPYFLSVTNSTREDKFYNNAGYGVAHVDIAAPGSGGFSLESDNEYGSYGGTSASTPHVAGAIGLLHSLNCPEVITLSKEEPGLFALLLKNALMESVDILPSLEKRIKSSGRLNILQAAAEIGSGCVDIGIPSERGALNILEIKRLSTDVYNIEYISSDERDNYNYMVLDLSGRILRKGNFQPQKTGKKQLYLRDLQLSPNIYYFTIYNYAGISTKSFLVIE